MTLAVIPARGGSKRLPRKNIVDFFGKPIIAYTIEAALGSRCFGRVLVSTEDREISDIAIQHGAEVADRPADLAGDSATVVDVCIDILNREAAAGKEYDVLCCLYPAAPLRGIDDIRAVVDLIEPGLCDFALAVTSVDQPPHQVFRTSANRELVALFPDLIDKRQDEFGDLVTDNGSTYAVSIAAFLQDRTFLGPKLRGHAMPRARSTDIDDQEDLEMARYFYQRLTG